MVKNFVYKFMMMNSPVGHLKLVGSEHGLAGVLWENDNPQRVRLDPQVFDDTAPILKETEKQLSEFFDGKRTAFNLPLDFNGTVFQKAVWMELLNIPFGKLRTYGEIAKLIGRPNAVRAVGAANGKNPISIIAPCHRVIGSNGSLTGFAGGCEIKAILLKFEGHLIDDPMGIPYNRLTQIKGQRSLYVP